MHKVVDNISGYTYGASTVSESPVSLAELAQLKITAGFTDADHDSLRLAGQVLAGQTQKIVEHWRNRIIAGIPNLARHSRALDGSPIPFYSAQSGLRFEQWILDTCLRPYDQDWLNYQHEIALRHTRLKKNQTDDVSSTAYVPLRDIIAFVAVMNQTIKPYLAASNAPADQVDKMHGAWCKSVQLQLALCTYPYTDPSAALSQW